MWYERTETALNLPGLSYSIHGNRHFFNPGFDSFPIFDAANVFPVWEMLAERSFSFSVWR